MSVVPLRNRARMSGLMMIHHQLLLSFQRGQDAPSFPSIGAEEQMNGSIVELRRRREVAVYHLPDARRSVCARASPLASPTAVAEQLARTGEAYAFHVGLCEVLPEPFDEPLTLRRLACPVESFEHDKGAHPTTAR